MNAKWKNELRRRAGSHGMCADKRHALERLASDSDAISLYLGSIEWALGENHPTVQEIRDNFSAKQLERNGIFIDREFNGETLFSQPQYIFHNCKGIIRVGLDTDTPNIPFYYFANGCEMTVRSAADYPFPIRVPLLVYGKNPISTENSENIAFNIKNFTVK